MDQVAIEVKNVSKTFTIGNKGVDTLKSALFKIFENNKNNKAYQALTDINFEVKRGETFGIIGRNGSGKSTLVRMMSGAYVPNKGGIIKRNGTSMLLNLGVGMSHELTARENIYVSGSALGLKVKEIDVLFDQIIQFSELEDFVDSKIKHYSSGMIQRLSFSIAVNAGADIMFLDEVFAVGDAKFKKKAVEVIENNWLSGRTIILVSHSMSTISKYCDRVLYLKKGKMEYLGDPKEAIKMYKNDTV